MLSWQDWAACSAPILGTIPQMSKCTMSEDLAESEITHPSYPYVPNIIGVIQECMDSEQRDLSDTMQYLLKHYSNPYRRN